VGQKKLGLEDQTLVKAMTPFAGGISTSGGVCGALTGALAFLGSLLGRDEPEKKDDPLMWKACQEVYKRFEKEVVAKWGSVNCRDIAGVDWSNQEEVLAFYKGDGITQCVNNTGKAARILGEVLEKHLSEK